MSAAVPCSRAPLGSLVRGKPVQDAAGQFAETPDDVAFLTIRRVYSQAAQTGVHKPAGAVCSVFEAAQLSHLGPRTPPRRIFKRSAQPWIDIDLVVIDLSTPMPPRQVFNVKPDYSACPQDLADQMPARHNVRTQDWVTLLGHMPPGSSVLMTHNQAQALRLVAKAQGIAVSGREVAHGVVRVWRLADVVGVAL